MKYKCDNCGRISETVEPLGNWHMEPGSVVPEGECSECGGYCYPFEEQHTSKSQFAAQALAALMGLLSEKRRQELEDCDSISVNVSVTPTFPLKKIPVTISLEKDPPNIQNIKFRPSFKFTREQLEEAAKSTPSIVELLEKQISEQAMEDFARLVHRTTEQQRRDWKELTFASRYGMPMSSLKKRMP